MFLNLKYGYARKRRWEEYSHECGASDWKSAGFSDRLINMIPADVN